MRHGFATRKLNRTASHRKAMFRAMTCSLLAYEKIKTTLPKAKELRPIVEKIITMGKKGTLHARRIAMSRLQDASVVKKLFEDVSIRFKKRNGGYIRILKAGRRYGDSAPMAYIEFVDKNIEASDSLSSNSKSGKN